MKILGKVTPLWIVAAFITLNEAVLGYSVINVTDGVQIALTVFFISFTLLVFSAFFFNVMVPLLGFLWAWRLSKTYACC